MKKPVRRGRLRPRNLFTLADRVKELEAEVAECRQLNLRLAELTDVVVELLVPLAQDNPQAREALDRYLAGVNDPGPNR